MQYMVEQYLMGGPYMNKTVTEMVLGYNSTLAAAVNGGTFLQGNEFALLSPVTPVLND